MEKILPKDFLHQLKCGQCYAVALIDNWFYYVEKDHIYRFEQHSNQKMKISVQEFDSGLIDEQEVYTTIKELTIKQMYYDWFTDVLKEKIETELSFLQKEIRVMYL